MLVIDSSSTYEQEYHMTLSMYANIYLGICCVISAFGN